MHGTCYRVISILPKHPHVHLQAECTIPAFAFSVEAGTNLSIREGCIGGGTQSAKD